MSHRKNEGSFRNLFEVLCFLLTLFLFPSLALLPDAQHASNITLHPQHTHTYMSPGSEELIRSLLPTG